MGSPGGGPRSMQQQRQRTRGSSTAGAGASSATNVQLNFLLGSVRKRSRKAAAEKAAAAAAASARYDGIRAGRVFEAERKEKWTWRTDANGRG